MAVGETMRLVDNARPDQGKVMRAGESTRLSAAIDSGRRFTADFQMPDNGADDRD
ncbi:hypothetical protein ACTOB_000924 [Actinoplanes oblitus]|uniref:Uncharacterized protein n=1 Tax=Actinoplanes oblitus TaxID=3040509 RepID=A0ABY8WLJ1_9ACTN|nr:hypothetical protein [Actinoplanes oblitus]WIM97408.1 hypothetical protein ACTOB_000924 [Actinoplanes oblitus]